MKKILTLVLAAVMAVTVLAACGSSSGSGQTTGSAANEPASPASSAAGTNQNADISGSKADVEAQLADAAQKAAPGEYFGDLITIACASGPNTWDPYVRTSGYGTSVLIFEKLGQADNQGNFHLQMLKSINKVDDVTYECELWDFIEDTAGNNITADDVKWSIQTVIDSGNQGAVPKLDSIEVTGDYTFIWHCKAAFGAGEFEKQFSNPAIVSQKSYEGDPDKMAANPVGTGPYKLKEFMEGSYGIYEANEDYWYNNIDDEAWLAENDGVWSYQNYKEIRCDVISDASARAIALETGAVDGCTKMNIADVVNYEGNPDFTTIDQPVDPPVSFYFNVSENSLCADENLRKAICYAVDNVGVAEGLDCPAVAAYGIQPRMFDAPEEWKTGREYYDYNVDKAKELLAESSYNGEVLTVMYTDGDQRVPSWTLMQAMLKDVGINVEFSVIENSVFEDARYDFTRWDIISETMGGGSYLPNTLKKWYSGDVMNHLNGLSTIGIEEPELDKLYEDVLNIHDDASIAAWDQYFTFDKCYGYGVCSISDQTACSSKFIPVVSGSQSSLTPGAFSPAE